MLVPSKRVRHIVSGALVVDATAGVVEESED
jgi:hypothetical protein